MDINGQHQIRNQTLAGIRPPTMSTGNSRWKNPNQKMGSLEACARGNSIYNVSMCQTDLGVEKKCFLKDLENFWGKKFAMDSLCKHKIPT